MRPITVSSDGKRVRVVIERVEDDYVAVCPQKDLSYWGFSKREALEGLLETINAETRVYKI